MRFDELRDLTPLQSGPIESELGTEQVLAVLPVSETGPEATTYLIALPNKLGLATLGRASGRLAWSMRWAPWDAVSFGASAPKRVRRARRPLRAAVRVGRHTFHSVLAGAPGQAALRDFVRAVRSRHEALSLPRVA